MRPPEPAEPQPPEGYEELWKTITVGQLGVLPADHPIVVWNRETEERRLAIHRKYSAKCRRLSRKCGADVAEANFDKRVDEFWKIAHRIFATQAHTIDGMKIKLRTVERLEIKQGNFEDAWASLEKDIRALSVA
jgi:FAD/FMN-containing dehydrogenase